jgi:L-ribulokinase
MTSVRPEAFHPDPAARAIYDELYRIYRELHDGFGGVPGAKGDMATIMKRLLALRERVVSATGAEVARA